MALRFILHDGGGKALSRAVRSHYTREIVHPIGDRVRQNPVPPDLAVACRIPQEPLGESPPGNGILSKP
jgi:hypothetical protein